MDGESVALALSVMDLLKAGKGEQSRLWGEDQCCSRRCSSGGSRARWVLLRLLLPASSEAVQCWLQLVAPALCTGPDPTGRLSAHQETRFHGK